MRLLAAFAATTILLTGSTVQAQGGPPFITDDPGTPGSNRWEINLSTAVENRPSEYLVQAPIIDINYGAGDRIQLAYETAWNLEQIDGKRIESELGNSHFGVKWRFVDRNQDASPADFSVYPQFDFNPVSSSEFGLLDRDSELFLPLETAFIAGEIDFAAELGYNVVFSGPDGLAYGIVAAHSFRRVQIGAEFRGAADVDFDADELVLTLGAVIDLLSAHNLLVSVGRSPREIDSGGPVFMGYLGVQLHLP